MTTAPIPNEPRPERPGPERTRSDRPQVDAGRLWPGGIATAVVAGLVALVGVLVCRWLFGIPLLAPKSQGAYGDVHTTDLVLLAAGACLLANKKARLAAGTLGATILLLMLVVYLPMLIAAPTSVVAMNYFADTLMFGGAVLVLADSLR